MASESGKGSYDEARAREFLDAYGQKVNPSSVAEESQKATTTLLAALLRAGENIPGIRMRVVPGKNSVEVEGLRGSVVVECTPDWEGPRRHREGEDPRPY